MEYQVFISPLAIEQIKKQLVKRGTPNGYLRLGLATGCSGFSYQLQFEEQVKPRDHLFQIDDIKVIVDPKSIIYLNGCTLDYEKTLIKSGFKFINDQNEQKKCGCGNSFEPKERQ